MINLESMIVIEELKKNVCGLTSLSEVLKHSKQHTGDTCFLRSQNYKNVEETDTSASETQLDLGRYKGKEAAENKEGIFPSSVSQDKILRFVTPGQGPND